MPNVTTTLWVRLDANPARVRQHTCLDHEFHFRQTSLSKNPTAYPPCMYTVAPINVILIFISKLYEFAQLLNLNVRAPYRRENIPFGRLLISRSFQRSGHMFEKHRRVGEKIVPGGVNVTNLKIYIFAT